jgi:hypothetical protein
LIKKYKLNNINKKINNFIKKKENSHKFKKINYNLLGKLIIILDLIFWIININKVIIFKK